MPEAQRRTRRAPKRSRARSTAASSTPRGPSVAYTVRGGLGTALPHVLPGRAHRFVLQEIGTYPPLKVLHALREENRWHFFGDGSIVHPAKQRLREALCPAAVDWRRRAVAPRASTLAAARRRALDVRRARKR